MRILTTLLALAVSFGLASTASAAEICGNGIDEDSNGSTDTGCWPAGVTKVCENPMSCKVTGDIAPKSGGIVYQVPLPDIDPKVPYGPSLQFRRTYQSLFANSGLANYRKSMGNRWHHSFQGWLDKSGTTVVVHLTTGQDVLFTYSATVGGYDYYTPQAGYHFKHLRQATSSPNNWDLKTLTGETFVYNWASPTGKLIEIQDPLANKVTITYFTSGGNAGQIDHIDDASGKKRITFLYNNANIVEARYQTVSGGTPTIRVTAQWTYTNANPLTFKLGGVVVQTMTYTSNYLTLIEDGGGNDIISLAYVAANLGQTARVTTGEGGIGYGACQRF